LPTNRELPERGSKEMPSLAGAERSRSSPQSASVYVEGVLALFLFGQLSASAQTQAYTVDELEGAMQEAGFVEVEVQPFLPDLTFLVSGRKP